MTECQHPEVDFIGMYSMVGEYVCRGCKAKIDPADHHRRIGEPHFEVGIEEYAPEFQDRIRVFWEGRTDYHFRHRAKKLGLLKPGS